MKGTINEEYLLKLCKLGTIAELKKIKEELNNKSFAYSLTDNFKKCTFYRAIQVSDMEKILDKHIAELKGENKQSKCNNCQNNTDELSGECYECVKGIEDWYEPLEENKE